MIAAFAVAVLMAMPFQVYVLPALLPLPWVPHLGILLVFIFSIAFGETVGVVLGLILGLLYDRFTAGNLGLHLLLLPCVAMGVALLKRMVPELAFSWRLAALGVASLVVELASAMLYQLEGTLYVGFFPLIHYLVPAVLANIVWGAAGLYMVRNVDDGDLA